MKKLIKGIIDFRKNLLNEYRTKFSKLALRQSPDTLFVACCDSRVVPNVFASSDPGDLFVLRNIGNLIPAYHEEAHGSVHIDSSVSAAIEFSLLNLAVKDIVICGHSECGAMEALINNDSKNFHLPSASNAWLNYAASSYKRFKEYPAKNAHLTPCNLLSQINVLQQMDNLKTYPLVTEQLQRNSLTIHGWWFDLTTADVYYWDSKNGNFALIDETEAKKLIE